MLEVRRFSLLHGHVLTSHGRGEDSQTESETVGPEVRHQDGQEAADGGLGRAGHVEGEGDVLYAAQYEAVGLLGGDVEPHLGPGEDQAGSPGAQSGLVTPQSDLAAW